MLRILGACPACGVVDTIIGGETRDQDDESERVQCGHCQRTWLDWVELIEVETAEGRKLIPTEVDAGRGVVELNVPLRDGIPLTGVITAVLNAALAVKFELAPLPLAEGGVHGFGGKTALANRLYTIGLECLHQGSCHAAQCGNPSILHFYERMLRLLFEKPITAASKRQRPGAILWLGADEEGLLAAWVILKAVLTRAGGWWFPRAVTSMLERLGESGRTALRGYSDKTEAAFFRAMHENGGRI